MRQLTVAAVAGLMLGASSMAVAEMGVGVKAGTLGFGAELTYGISESFNARLGLNSYSFSDTDSYDDIEYDMDLDWQSSGLFLDWHPFQGTFRLTLGYLLNSNEIAMVSTPSSTYDIGGVSYDAADVGKLNGAVDFGDGIFYGLGWGNAGNAKGLGFIFELGVLQQSPDLALKASGGTLSDDPTFQENLRREERDAQDDLDDFDQYPVVSLGISYSF
ncbi:MAG: hypothetical protein OQL05_03250 [Gammaproteobacteria bacterium]|nr:hypothetical protein [Gammaproteobacteria bacterium]MCW8959024.1 hypothetical protein [Gammaproteobacteria bacterium]MCW8972277.1 hypothetical protein [Gammaproteobacteria bacterium]MCW8991872.1 hypothetical protein [Gammaproteobacteria bacterium]